MIRKEILVALLAGAVALVWTFFHFDRGLDLFDAGLYATEAWRVLEGQTYGSDFIAPYGPGRYYLIALLFSFFGASLKVQAGLFLALRGVVAFLTYIVSRNVLSRTLALVVTAAVSVAPGALHKSLFQTVVLLNVAAWFLYRRKPGSRTCLVAGLVAGGGALFRVDAGVFGAVSFVTLLALELVWDRPPGTLSLFAKRLGFFALAALLPTAPVALLLAASGDLAPLLEAELHRTAAVSALAEAVSVPGFLDACSAGSMKKMLLSLLIPGAPVALVLLGTVVLFFRVRGDRRKGALELLALAIYGLPVMNQLRITPTFNHLLQSAPLALIAATLLLSRLGGGAGRVTCDDGESSGEARSCAAGADTGPGRSRGTLLLRAVAPLALLPALALVVFNLCFTRADSVLPGSIRNRAGFTVPIDLERAGLHETGPAARDIRAVVAAVERMSEPGDTIFVTPFCPAVHFLAARLPAGPLLEPFYYFGSGTLQTRMVRALAASEPELVVLGGPVQSVGGRNLSRDAPVLRAWVLAHYSPSIRAGTYQIWERKR